MFHSARLKLTAWYLLIIVTISVLFSVTIFLESNRELTRFERVQEVRVEFERENVIHLRPPMISPQEIAAARTRLILTLLLINGSIAIFSSFAGYFLAGRTLTPIQKMVDEQRRFITDASHELRTPLTSLRSEIEVALRDKDLSADDAKKLFKSNLEEVISLQELSNSLLELSQNGQLINPMYITEIPITQLIDKAVKKVQGAAKIRKVVIMNEVKGSMVLGVEDRLSEVFVILLDNAIKYSKPSGKVMIKSKKIGGKLDISIVDYGIGIYEKDLPFIFNRFYRAESSRSETSGYGLGLSIARKIVEAHNGKITASSGYKDKKTIFVVSLPAA